MKATIISIGDEILIGQILDSNSKWIAQQLNTIGISVYQIISVQDNEAQITGTLQTALRASDIVILTGGLGPTKDDITKTSLIHFFKDHLVLNKAVATHVKELFAKMNFRFVASDLQQAMLPSKAIVLPNAIGTASGMWFDDSGKIVVSLPGVPAEMKHLMQTGVLPKLQQNFQLPFIIHKTLITYGVRESEMAIRLQKFEEQLPENIGLAYLPNYRRLRLRLTAKGTDKELLSAQIREQVHSLEKLLSDVVVGFDEDYLLEAEIGNLLRASKQSLATAESCTGGNIAHLLTMIPGASTYFVGSIVSYSAEVKIKELLVSKELIDTYSVVSAQVAEAMAAGVRKKFNTDYAIATTGNAGPTTDKTDKSVGDVYIAIASPMGVKSYLFNFGQPREKVIFRSSSKALELLQKEIIKNNG